MRSTSLDILEKAELPPNQSHAILKVMELELASAHEPLATKADVAELRAVTKADLAELRAVTKADLAELRAVTKADLAELRVEMKALEGTLTRWVLSCILGQTAVLAGLGYFALTHVRR